MEREKGCERASEKVARLILRFVMLIRIGYGNEKETKMLDWDEVADGKWTEQAWPKM